MSSEDFDAVHESSSLTGYSDTWDNLAVEAAYNDDTPADQKPLMVYAASKTKGEQAAWNFVTEQRPDFILNTVLPNMSVRSPFYRSVQNVHYLIVKSSGDEYFHLRSRVLRWAGRETSCTEMIKSSKCSHHVSSITSAIIRTASLTM